MLALNWGEQKVDAGPAARVVNIGPILIAVLSGGLLDERFPPGLVAGITVSFAGVIVAAFGFASLLQAGMAALFGNEFVYGAIQEEVRIQQTQQLDVHRAEDALRGVTFAVTGVGFWLMHWLARNRTGDHGPLQRGYLLVGAAAFGIATVALLPNGLYQALTLWLIPRAPQAFRPGVQDSLSGGLAAVVIWLIYLRIIVWDLPRTGRRREEFAVPREPGPPMEPTVTHARIGPRPSGRSASAEAVPPPEDR